MLSSSKQKNTLGRATLRTYISPAFALRVPNATAMARSVIMPTARPFSTTGSAPHRCFQRIFVTVARFVSGLQNRTPLTMTSCTFIIHIVSRVGPEGSNCSPPVPAHEHLAAALTSWRDFESRRVSLQPFFRSSIVHEIRDHCCKIRGVIGVGFQIVLIFCQSTLRISLEVLDDS
jgi:hypothetical protein